MIVAFLGHSDTFLTEKLKLLIKNKLIEIIKTYEKVEFYLDGYGDFDYGCLDLLTILKKTYPNIKRVFVTPYLSNYSKLKNANSLYGETIYPPIENSPLKFSISKRNEWMVDNCDLLLCYVHNTYGGAYRAFKRACNKKVPFYNFAND